MSQFDLLPPTIDGQEVPKVVDSADTIPALSAFFADIAKPKIPSANPVLSTSSRPLENVAYHDFAFHEYFWPNIIDVSPITYQPTQHLQPATPSDILDALVRQLSSQGQVFLNQQNPGPITSLIGLVNFLLILESSISQATIASLGPANFLKGMYDSSGVNATAPIDVITALLDVTYSCMPVTPDQYPLVAGLIGNAAYGACLETIAFILHQLQSISAAGSDYSPTGSLFWVIFVENYSGYLATNYTNYVKTQPKGFSFPTSNPLLVASPTSNSPRRVLPLGQTIRSTYLRRVILTLVQGSFIGKNGHHLVFNRER